MVNQSPSFILSAQIARRLRDGLPAVAERVVEAIVDEVPSYSDPFRSGMGITIETAVRVALDGFLDLASGPASAHRRAQQERVRDAAYGLGQGEARAGRSIEALTRAYGVGARVAWRDIGTGAIDAGMAAADLAAFAELVFAYINDLSVLSINGHAEELLSSGQIRQRRLERLCQKLLEGAPADDIAAATELAEWELPRELIVVLLPASEADAAAAALGGPSLRASEDLTGPPADHAVLVIDGAIERSAALRALASSTAVVGPSRPWNLTGDSYARVLQAHHLGITDAVGPVDTDAHLLELVLGADPAALADLRARVLGPLQTVSPNARDKLAGTLRAWLLHHGRRDDIARALFVHPQTVRYRMGQLRDLYGERLSDPRFVLELTVALA